jgi:hypothetical protein
MWSGAALFLLRDLHGGPFSEVEGHTAADHPGWVARYDLLRPYPNQLQRVVYRRSEPPAS